MKLVIYAAAGVVTVALVGAAATSASPPMVSAAKKAGLPANNCQYCHTEAMPKKDTFKPESLNDRGKFLMADKQA
jgi:hypothetical protein